MSPEHVQPLDDDAPEPSAPNRRLVRERVMQTLYAFEVGQNAGGEAIEYLAGRILFPEFHDYPELIDFARRLLSNINKNAVECDTIIKRLAENWEFHRIAPIDKVLLRIGITEMLYFPEIPTKVTINEAIEIAKRYSTEKSGVFINGMLDAALSVLKSEGRLKKSGRGLIGEQ